MDSVGLTQQMLAQGFQILVPGAYALQQNVYLSPPKPPSSLNWQAFTLTGAPPRPCGIVVAANDVTLDLGGYVLSGCSEVTQGLVLVYVQPGVQNFTLLNGSLQVCAVAVLLDGLCASTTLRGLTIANFTQKGVLSYSPQGLALTNCVVGPNLSERQYASQETVDLVSYGPFVKARDLCAWACFSDDLKVQEEAHVVGVDVCPGELQDSPYPPQENTGSNVSLTNVQVLQLTMYAREHSIVASVGLRSGSVAFATGLRGEPLPEWYVLRRGAPASSKQLSLLAPVGQLLFVPYYPSLTPALDPWTLTQDFAINVADDELFEPQRTVWVRGVDRTGSALRGAQGVLVAGVPPAEISFSNVVVAEPVVKVLAPRVLLPPPKGIEARDLVVTLKATRVAVVPARGTVTTSAPAVTCCADNITSEQLLASLFEYRRSNYSSRAGYPPGNVPPLYAGSIFGVNAAKPIPIRGCFSAA